METKFLRFDVDNPCRSILRSFLSFRVPKFSNLSYLKPILDLLREYDQKGTFFFRPYYTMPSLSLVRLLFRDQHEIGHHVDHTIDIKDMRKEKLILESRCGKILGLTFHGTGLPIVSPSGEGYHKRYLEYCLKLGYKYEGTGHYIYIKKNGSFAYSNFHKLNELLIFPNHLTFDRFPKTYFTEKIMSVHPSRLVRNSKLMKLFEKVLKKYRFVPLREVLNNTTIQKAMEIPY